MFFQLSATDRRVLASMFCIRLARKNEVMARVQQLPRIAMTWGLMFLTVIAGGIRPSCICADGTLCVLCPKLMAAPAVSPSTEPSATNGSCSSKSCCCEHAATPTHSDTTAVCEMAGSPCDGCDCLAVPAALATVQKAENPASHLNCNVAPVMFATAEIMLSRESSCSRGDTPRVGSPPDLIVLFQRWLI